MRTPLPAGAAEAAGGDRPHTAPPSSSHIRGVHWPRSPPLRIDPHPPPGIGGRRAPLARYEASYPTPHRTLYEEDGRLPQTLSYFILNKLRWRIITGELEPGQALREREIEADYGSSRGPVRESLRMLLQSGLVEAQPRRGFRVREYTPADVRNIYELRATLEGMVVAALEGRDLTPLCGTLRGRLTIMESHYRHKNTDEYFRENSRFHQCIIDFTGNKPISQVLFYVNEISLPVRYRLMQEGSLSSRRSLDYHESITECLEGGDIAGARAVTEAHILENLERATAFYASPA